MDTLAPGATPLVAPENNALLNVKRPLFEWSAPTGNAVDYRLQVIQSSDTFQGPFVVNSRDIAQTQFRPTVDLADATYRWRVIARDRALNTATSLSRTFSVDTLAPGTPPLLAPPDNAFLNNKRPLFQWSASTGDVESYRIQVVESGDTFQGPFVINSGDITQTQFLPTGDLADATYRWRVIARDIASNTASSVTRTFTVDTLPPGTPSLVAPADNEFVNTKRPLFQWAAPTGNAVDYRLQVINSGDTFQGPFVFNTGDITETQFQATADLADTTYRWRVIARDRALNTAASVSRTFARGHDTAYRAWKSHRGDYRRRAGPDIYLGALGRPCASHHRHHRG